jgi:hypothetical protein
VHNTAPGLTLARRYVKLALLDKDQLEL